MQQTPVSIPVEQNVLNTHEVFYTGDPALTPESNVAKYRETMDPSYLSFAAGPNGEELHVTFVLRAVSYDDYMNIARETGGSLNDTHRELARVGTVGWDNWRYMDEDGKVRYLQPLMESRPGRLSRLSEPVFRMMPDKLRLELGRFVYAISRIDHYREVRRGKADPPAAEHAKN